MDCYKDYYNTVVIDTVLDYMSVVEEYNSDYSCFVGMDCIVEDIDYMGYYMSYKDHCLEDKFVVAFDMGCNIEIGKSCLKYLLEVLVLIII